MPFCTLKHNPILGYGSTGPYANDPGYDVIAEAVGGFMGTTGSISYPPK